MPETRYPIQTGYTTSANIMRRIRIELTQGVSNRISVRCLLGL